MRIIIKETPVRGRQVYYKEDEIKAARRYLGYFALITNEKMHAFTALHLYRMKVIVEKAFGNIKDRLNMRRLLAKSENPGYIKTGTAYNFKPLLYIRLSQI